MHQSVNNCRICGGTKLEPYLDLGTMPLVNNLVDDPRTTSEPKFPLVVLFCHGCGLSQLSVVVAPEVMFSNYVYRSSISKTFANHCAQLAQTAQREFGLGAGDLVVDLASNDGCALREFLPFGVRPLGVDPARNLAAMATAEGIPTIARFWSRELAEEIVTDHGHAKIMTAMNVFAHVHDLRSFIQGVARVLAEDGTFIVEVPYLVDLLKDNIFDTVYHEHLSYYLLNPLIGFCASEGLHVNRADRIDIHGGTLRLYIQRHPAPHASLQSLLQGEREGGYLSFDRYREFSKCAEKIKRDLVATVRSLHAEGKSVAAFGASAKGSIMLNYCGLGRSDILYTVDDTPEKQGKYMAGTHIPIVSRKILEIQRPDYLLVLAWNFFKEVQAKTAEFREQGGKYLLPVPSLHVV